MSPPCWATHMRAFTTWSTSVLALWPHTLKSGSRNSIRSRVAAQRAKLYKGRDLVGNKRPGDAIAGVNPDLVAQEGKRLMCSVAVLRAHLQLPIIRQRRNRKKDRNQQSTS